METEQTEVRSWKWLFVKGLIVWTTFVACICYLSIQVTILYSIASEWATNKAQELRYATIRLLDDPPAPMVGENEQEVRTSLEQVVRESAERHGINPLVPLAMIQQESDFTYWSSRFEPKLKARFASKIKRESWMVNPENADVLFTSYGSLQIVYGLHRETCGLTSYAQLIEPDQRINIECGMTILSRCLNRRHGMKDAQRLRLCLAEYNGSEEYAQVVLARLTGLLLKDTQLMYDQRDEIREMQDRQLVWNREN